MHLSLCILCSQVQRNTVIYVYMLFRTCSKFAAFWYQKSALDFFSNLYIAELYFFGVKSITPSENLLLVTSLVFQRQKAPNLFLVLFGNKSSEFYFFASCTWMPGTIWCALHCHKWKSTACNQFRLSLARRCRKTALHVFLHLQPICSILVLKTVLWTFWQSVHG